MNRTAQDTFRARSHRGRLALPLVLALGLLAGCNEDSQDDAAKQTSDAKQPAASTPAPNQAPKISGTMPSQVLVGQSLNFTPQASDPDGNTLTFAAAGLPSWMSIDPATGTIHGKPSSADAGTYGGIVVTVSDGQLSASLPAQQVAVVAAANGKATLSWVPPTENVDGTPLIDLSGYRIRYGTSPNALDQAAEITNPGVASYVIENLTPATWYFVVTAYTKAGVESDLSNLASKTITG